MPSKFLYRSVCISLALITRSRMDAEDSPFDFVLLNSLKATGVTSTCKSILSNKGPDILLRYF